jgi:hypothetical protein
VVDAPGKRHRKPVPDPVGAKAAGFRTGADSRIARMKIANASQRGRRG